MKDTMLDVLIYLFENFMDSEAVLHLDPDHIVTVLEKEGFLRAEIDKAFHWLDGLQTKPVPIHVSPLAGTPTRHFAKQECNKLDLESRRFLIFLEKAEVLTPESRELVLDRVMALEEDEIDIDQLKWVILMVFYNLTDETDNLNWLEDYILEDFRGQLH